MADTGEGPNGHEETSKAPEVQDKGEEYLRSILRELGDALSTAIAGESMKPMSTESIIPPHVLQSLRKQLQSLQSEFWSTLRSDGYHRGMIDTMIVPPSPNTRSDLLKHIKDVRDSKSSHGEVTGFCVSTVCDVFFEQAVPWGAMALEFVERCRHTTRNVLASILACLAPTDVTTTIVQTVLEPLMSEILPEVQRKLADLLSPSTHGYPLIYDPGFHDCIHDRRQVCLKIATRERLREYSRKRAQFSYGLGNIGLDTEEQLVEALTEQTKAEADQYACAEMLSCAQGLYQNALGTFQKNVPVQCIEVGMLARLSMALSPDLVQHIGSEVLDTLVIESPDARLERLDRRANQGDPGNVAQQGQTANDDLQTTVTSAMTWPRTFQWQDQESSQCLEQTGEKTLTPEEARQMKEKRVLYFRLKLQHGFLGRADPPEEDELISLSDYLDELEALPDLAGDIIKATKVHKVLKGILKLATIPHDTDYHFKDRSLKLLAKWNETLAKEESGDRKEAEKGGISTPTLLEPVGFPFASKPSSDVFTNTAQHSMPHGTGSPTSSTASIPPSQPTGAFDPFFQASQPSSGVFNAPSPSLNPPAATSSASSFIETPTPSSSVPSTPSTQLLSGPGPISCSFPAPAWGRIDTSSTTNAINTNSGGFPPFSFGKSAVPTQQSFSFGHPSEPAHSIFNSVDLSKATGPAFSSPNLAKPTDQSLIFSKPPQTDPSKLSSSSAAPWPLTKQETSTSASTSYPFAPTWSDCPGTGAHEVFHPCLIEFPTGESVHYQHVVMSLPLRSFSPEECRLADYKMGQRFGKLFKI